MNSLHRYLTLIGPGPAKLSGATDQQRSRLSGNEELWQPVLGQPGAIGLDNTDDISRGICDWEFARPYQSGQTIFSTLEWGTIGSHLFLTQRADDAPREHGFDEEVLFEH